MFNEGVEELRSVCYKDLFLSLPNEFNEEVKIVCLEYSVSLYYQWGYTLTLGKNPKCTSKPHRTRI